jgi:hypothetical protein
MPSMPEKRFEGRNEQASARAELTDGFGRILVM